MPRTGSEPMLRTGTEGGVVARQEIDWHRSTIAKGGNGRNGGGSLCNWSLRWHKVGWRFSEGFEGQRWVVQEGRGVPINKVMIDPAKDTFVLVPPELNT